MLLKICWDVGLHLPKRMVVTCKKFVVLKEPSKFFFSERVASPLPHESHVGFPGCAGNEFIITQYDVLSLLR